MTLTMGHCANYEWTNAAGDVIGSNATYTIDAAKPILVRPSLVLPVHQITKA